ncbi:MAG: DMT family transporter [Bacteroidia bacterium]|nr:DMT family transporter [Bacteroidia bacterium]MDW8088991.1 DMT family transporter [Bacteroidia bacterium]
MRSPQLLKDKQRLAPWKGHLALLGQTAIICGGYVFGRKAAQHFDPFFLTGLRAVLSGLIYLTLLPFLRRWGAFTTSWTALEPIWRQKLWRLALLGIFFNQFLFNTGLRYTTAATTALIYALTPSVVFGLGVWVFRRERFHWRKVAGLIAAYAGVVLALWHNLLHAAHGWGWLAILAAVGFWAWYLQVSPPVVQTIGPLGTTALVMILGAFLHLPTLLLGLWRQEWEALSVAAWTSLAYLVVGMSVVAYLLLSLGLRYLTPTRTALYINLQPIGTLILAAALGQEPLSWQLASATLLTTVGLFLFTDEGR